LRKLDKDGEIGQDDARAETDRVQKATDEAIAEIDQLVAAKEQEIMHV
jgi:ribosome recycling factor